MVAFHAVGQLTPTRGVVVAVAELQGTTPEAVPRWLATPGGALGEQVLGAHGPHNHEAPGPGLSWTRQLRSSKEPSLPSHCPGVCWCETINSRLPAQHLPTQRSRHRPLRKSTHSSFVRGCFFDAHCTRALGYRFAIFLPFRPLGHPRSEPLQASDRRPGLVDKALSSPNNTTSPNKHPSPEDTPIAAFDVSSSASPPWVSAVHHAAEVWPLPIRCLPVSMR